MHANARPPYTFRPAIRRLLTCAAIALAFLPAAANAQNCPTRWDTSPGAVGIAGTAYAALPLPSGDVIVGGQFTTAGGVTVNNITRYHPATNTWSAMGGGFTFASAYNIVRALARTSNGDIIAGGDFESSSIHHIARWSDSTATWTPLGPGLGHNVHAILPMPDGTILAGGNFTSTGTGLPLQQVARFDPQTNAWTSWPFSFHGSIYALALAPNGDVYAGGGVPLVRLSAATNTWSTVSTPSMSNTFAFVIAPNGDVLAPGTTPVPPASSRTDIWRFDKNTGIGTAMGGGNFLTNAVGALGVNGAGDIYAYASFTSTGTPTNSTVLRWDAPSAQWALLSPAPNTGAHGITNAFAIARLANGDLFFAGDSSTIGAQPAHAVAILTTRPICSADFNCSGSLDVQDIVDYINAWFNGDSSADFNRGGGPQIQDIFDFLNAWFVGCP